VSGQLPDPDGVLFRIEGLLSRVDTEPNDFDHASAAWRWWQGTAEELASLVDAIGEHLRSGGRMPIGWMPGASADWAVVKPVDQHLVRRTAAAHIREVAASIRSQQVFGGRAGVVSELEATAEELEDNS
jgi:hypothetical protein